MLPLLNAVIKRYQHSGAMEFRQPTIGTFAEIGHIGACGKGGHQLRARVVNGLDKIRGNGNVWILFRIAVQRVGEQAGLIGVIRPIPKD